MQDRGSKGPINLKKLISKKAMVSMIRNVMRLTDTAFCVTDADGNTLIGTGGTYRYRLPVEIEGELIGWVSADREAELVVAIIADLVGSEFEKKAVIKDCLEKYKELTLLYDVAGKIAGCHGIEDVARLLIDIIMRAIKADNVSIMLINDVTQELEMLYASGQEFFPKSTFRLGEGIAGYVAVAGKAEIVNDVLSDPRYLEGPYIAHSLICAPLKTKERVIGVLNISRAAPVPYYAEDLNLATTLAFQAAMSIECARYITQLKASEQEYRLMYEEYHSLYENAVEGIFRSTPDGYFTSVNPSFLSITGFASTSDVKTNLSDWGRQLFVHDADNARFRQILLDEKHISGFEAQMHRKDGKRIWVSISAKGVCHSKDQEKIAFYEGFLVDVSERKEKEKARRAQEEAEKKSLYIRDTFGRYLSDEVVSNILERPGGLNLGGEKRIATIMLSDLRGFSLICEQLPAEHVVRLLNNYLEVMTKLIFNYHGTIDEFVGDAIMVIFGAPIQREDDALRAVACAVEMQLAMNEVNRWNAEHNYPVIEMGIGINTGPVVVGNIGSVKRIKYSAVGNVVNMASRIESYTIGGQILISESTRSSCGPGIDIVDQMDVQPKGAKTSMRLFQVDGIGGEYKLFLPKKKEVELKILPKPLPIHFMMLSGKHPGKNVYHGNIVRLFGALAEIQADVAPEKLTDLRIELFDQEGNPVASDLYAKVSEHNTSDSSVFNVHFTFIPPDADIFIRRTLDALF